MTVDTKTANAEAQKKFNQAQAKKGLKRIEVRAREEDVPRIRAYVAKLNKKAGIS